MKARVAHLTGSRAGTDIVVWKRYATIGRAPQADVRLAPDSDLMVAARHAALVWHDGVWAIRDLGSTNGTYVDGSRVHGESVLRDGALVQLGRDGPTFRFSVIFEPGAPEPVHTSDIAAGDDPDALRTLPRIPVILAGGREVLPATDAVPSGARTRWAAVGALVMTLVAAGWLSLARARPGHDAEAMRHALLARADRAFEALERLPRAAPMLTGPAREAQSRVAHLRSRVRRVPAAPASLAALGDSLTAVEAAGARLEHAATLDVPALLRDGAAAMTLVEAELEGGRRLVTPAVAVRRRDGRTVYYVALRRGLVDDVGRLPRALRVRGAAGGSAGAVVARGSAASGVLLLSPTADAGATPVPLAGSGSSPGEPALLLGLDGQGTTRAATAALGIVSAVGADEMRLELLGAEVPAGSVVLDRGGSMMGLVVPGDDPAPRDVRAVPAAALLQLVELAGAG